ncbi:hypothetical protein ElP_40300 [Tautonia plasticadhaerens]|uniref:Uncharacterized protein n=1 Tax=Tautonia plasticadhaerens TaxID=2527974 RepID=A0A518H5J5_9BACT|nr:hypothetical protein ElP_40300 [Tautonia plasticadhaerens]
MTRQDPGGPTPGPADPLPLLPPRPNLGPEPWRDLDGADPWAISAAVLLLASVAVIGARVIARRRGRAASVPAPAPGPAGPSAPGSRADRLVARAEAIREAIIAHLGPSWAARTTEEIADSPELASRIGPDRAARVVALLAEADRAKFAGEVPPGLGDQGGDDAEADRWAAEVVRALARPAPRPSPAPAPAGASSTSSGR